ncbi:MAG TPA: cyclic dehypoxanthinyl futalosine synthase [Egibacteraceae bacterium]|nr:cyclic dehypoxanthinyl futalosine synthase [Egibacteraceae bacterium]
MTTAAADPGLAREVDDILARGADGQRLSEQEAVLLLELAPFMALGRAADAVRRRRYPEGFATFLIDRNINYTNVCVTSCKFCAFYRPPRHEEGWTHDFDEIDRRVDEAATLGATQIMFQGGHNPTLGISWYEELFSHTKARHPEMALHSLGSSEIMHISSVSAIDVAEVIARLRDAGLDSLAGAGAEMLVERVRGIIAPLKESGQTWLDVMETAHGLGVESTATMMMGTVETLAERVEHMRMVRDLQDRTGGFRAFIHWSYQAEHNTLKGQSPSSFDYLRALAVARLFLDNVAHIQSSWLTTGKEVGQLGLHFGADDMGSVMLEENVVSSAGAKHRSNTAEIVELIRAADRVPAQRNTRYELLRTFEDRPWDGPVALTKGMARPDDAVSAADRSLPVVQVR